MACPVVWAQSQFDRLVFDPGCIPRRCGRAVWDGVMDPTDLNLLKATASGLMDLTGGSSGGVRGCSKAAPVAKRQPQQQALRQRLAMTRPCSRPPSSTCTRGRCPRRASLWTSTRCSPQRTRPSPQMSSRPTGEGGGRLLLSPRLCSRGPGRKCAPEDLAASVPGLHPRPLALAASATPSRRSWRRSLRSRADCR